MTRHLINAHQESMTIRRDGARILVHHQDFPDCAVERVGAIVFLNPIVKEPVDHGFVGGYAARARLDAGHLADVMAKAQPIVLGPEERDCLINFLEDGRVVLDDIPEVAGLDTDTFAKFSKNPLSMQALIMLVNGHYFAAADLLL